MDSKLQFFAPEQFWKVFKLWGQPVNVREQQVRFATDLRIQLSINSSLCLNCFSLKLASLAVTLKIAYVKFPNLFDNSVSFVKLT